MFVRAIEVRVKLLGARLSRAAHTLVATFHERLWRAALIGASFLDLPPPPSNGGGREGAGDAADISQFQIMICTLAAILLGLSPHPASPI